MKEFENLGIGVKYDPEVIKSILWVTGKTISDDVLTKWLKLNEEFIEIKGRLMVNEFLYLFANTIDKQEMVRKQESQILNIITFFNL